MPIPFLTKVFLIKSLFFRNIGVASELENTLEKEHSKGNQMLGLKSNQRGGSDLWVQSPVITLERRTPIWVKIQAKGALQRIRKMTTLML